MIFQLSSRIGNLFASETLASRMTLAGAFTPGQVSAVDRRQLQCPSATALLRQTPCRRASSLMQPCTTAGMPLQSWSLNSARAAQHGLQLRLSFIAFPRTMFIPQTVRNARLAMCSSRTKADVQDHPPPPLPGVHCPTLCSRSLLWTSQERSEP